MSYDRNQAIGGHLSGLERVLDFDTVNDSGDDDFHNPSDIPQFYDLPNPHDQLQANQGSYSDNIGAFQTPPYSERAPSLNEYSTYDDMSGMQIRSEPFHGTANLGLPNGQTIPAQNGPSWSNDQFNVAELTEVLGELKIPENGEALYISQQKKSLAEAPALEEFEVKLPTMSTGSGSTVRIPPELMPSEDQCMEWFDIFFKDIHPYVPVISKPYFYKQWSTNRRLISPLILEAIFACAGRLSEDPAQGAQWLALASKHEDCFMDVPRLSTIQALLLLLKAREAAPKRGYYYRSWMTIKTVIALAQDLELHEHYQNHQAGRDCGADPTECLIKTRIWQNIFVCEMMIGGPQGRRDMGVEIDSVDFNVPRPTPGIDSSDYQVSRQFTYLVRMVRNVRSMSEIYAKVKRQKDWGSNPQFANLTPELDRWHADLPRDLQLHLSEDGTPPWIPSHFVGNMHCYYHLTNLMLERPQLMKSDSFSAGGSWKQHMASCYSSAKAMCRLQEGTMQAFGLPGLLCMQRGINFVIYCVLSCTMIHLVAITSPDPDFYTDAKDYFTRHMRILEHCTSAWPMPEMQTQIDALREAFSADTSKPFQLRASFPHGSPASTLRGSPPADLKYQSLSRQTSHEIPYQVQPMTPPISAGLDESRDRSMPMSINVGPQQQPLPMPTTPMSNSHMGWNPTKIFDQWNTAFGTPTSTATSSVPQPSPPLFPPTSTMSHDISNYQDTMQQQQQYGIPSSVASVPQVQPVSQMPSYNAMAPNFVTSSMWRDTVASTYDTGGNKRSWDTEPPYLVDSGHPTKRPR